MVASDEIDPEEIEELEIEEVDPEEIDPAELEEDLEEEFEEDFEADDDDLIDEGVGAGATDSEDATAGATIVRKPGDDDDDEEDLLTADDVEEDLDKILKDKLTAEDVVPEDEEEVEVDDRSAGEDKLQPKRADEQLCSRCFLLVRNSAPVCPVGDDGCPLFPA